MPLKTVAPWDGALVNEVHVATPTEVESALSRATELVPELRAQPAHERIRLLTEIRAGVEARQAELADWIMREGGKPIRYARGEVARGLQTLTIAMEEAGRLAGEMVPLDWTPNGAGLTAFTRPVPVGVVIGISPFNFPLNLMLHKVAPAIAAGCPIIHKPSSSVPTAALVLQEIIDAANPIPGQVHILPMSAALAETMVTDPRPAAVSFTGSPAVGWALKAKAGRKRITLELGGNAAAIIAADADQELALTQSVEAAFAYAGQVCISLQRLFVHDSLYTAVRAQLLERITALEVGDPADPATIVGPLITVADAARIEEWVAEAVAAGGQILCGGERVGRQGFAPTLLESVPPSVRLSAEEAFGPVLILERFSELDDAIARVNASAYGLQAAIYTQDLATALTAHRQLEVGGVMVNRPPTFRIDSMPYGGVKASGFGREGVRYAIAEFTESRLCVLG